MEILNDNMKHRSGEATKMLEGEARVAFGHNLPKGELVWRSQIAEGNPKGDLQSKSCFAELF